MRGLRTWFSTSAVAPGRKPSGGLWVLDENPTLLRRLHLGVSQSFRVWCEDHSDLQLGLHQFQWVQFQLLPEGECSSAVCGQCRSATYLGGRFSISALLGSDLYVNPCLLSIIKAEIFLMFYMVLDCSISCLLFYMAIFCWINVYFSAKCGIQCFSAF